MSFYTWTLNRTDVKLKQQLSKRYIFCGYWLYFNGIRGVLGGIRALDFLGISLVVYGLLTLITEKRGHIRFVLDWQLLGWVTVLFCPLILVVVVDPSSYITTCILKMYVVTVYITLYMKSMRLTRIEWVCFAIPLVISLYFFTNPRDSALYQLSKGRMSGVSEPNFTCVSLIYAMCGAFGIYAFSKVRRVKHASLITVGLCFVGVILTASRAGFIGASFALCLFFVSEKRIRYASIALALAAFFITVSFSDVFPNKPLVLQRLLPSAGESVIENTSGRDILAAMAWDKIHRDGWFVGGGPVNVSVYFGGEPKVPHNSFLDIGLAFGKFPFYFYSTMFFLLFILNGWAASKAWRCRNTQEKETMLVTTLFLSLVPLYTSLSAGMTMGFQFWIALGAYPLLTKSTVLARGNNFFRRRVRW